MIKQQQQSSSKSNDDYYHQMKSTLCSISFPFYSSFLISKCGFYAVAFTSFPYFICFFLSSSIVASKHCSIHPFFTIPFSSFQKSFTNQSYEYIRKIQMMFTKENVYKEKDDKEEGLLMIEQGFFNSVKKHRKVPMLKLYLNDNNDDYPMIIEFQFQEAQEIFKKILFQMMLIK